MVSGANPEGGTSKNAAPGGFPTHRLPSAWTTPPPKPRIASPTGTAARGVAVRSADATDDRRALAPRQDHDERSSAIAMVFEPDSGPARAVDVGIDDLLAASDTRVPVGRRAGAATPVARRRPPKPPRSPAVGLIGLLLFAFIATFFAWFAAGPMWISLGHSHHGVATVGNCPVAGIDKRCAQFTADGGEFTATVTLLGPAGAQAARGATIPAEMVSKSNTMAYAGDASSLYLRWIPGLAIVLLCGFGIAWITGAYRLPGRRARIAALVASMSGPILIVAGMLAITW